MKKQLYVFLFVLVGFLALTIAALAADGTDGKVADSQTKQPAAAAVPAQEGKVAEGQPQQPVAAPAKAYNGKVIDAQSKEPIEGALVTLGDTVVRTDKDGVFHMDGTGEKLKLRAPGYARQEVAVSELTKPNAEIALTPFHGQGPLPHRLRSCQ